MKINKIKEMIKNKVYFVKCIYDYCNYLKVVKKTNKLNTNIYKD